MIRQLFSSPQCHNMRTFTSKRGNRKCGIKLLWFTTLPWFSYPWSSKVILIYAQMKRFWKWGYWLPNSTDAWVQLTWAVSSHFSHFTVWCLHSDSQTLTDVLLPNVSGVYSAAIHSGEILLKCYISQKFLYVRLSLTSNWLHTSTVFITSHSLIHHSPVSRGESRDWGSAEKEYPRELIEHCGRCPQRSRSTKDHGCTPLCSL